MFFSYFTLFVALSISAIAAWYSIIGLTAIFAAAVIPIIIMGGALEVAKITATVWLHQYWNQARWLMKLYLTAAVIILMIITSMGIFGFLSRAHIEQSAPIGDSVAQIEIIDERIAIEQEVIEQYRRDLTILNQQIERFSELGAVTRGVNARAAQQEERQAIFDRIESSQQTITDLRQQRAPFAADVRKIETEVGPIKYIAALIYGDNPDQNLLEKAVRWVIILLVVVFDPLAIMLVLAGVESIKWNREQRRIAAEPAPAYEQDDGALTDEQLEEIEAAVDSLKESSEPESVLEQHPYLSKPFVHFENLKPMVAPGTDAPAEQVFVDTEEFFEDLPEEPAANPLEGKRIADTTYGHLFPDAPTKGDLHVRTDFVPTRLYKYIGTRWIEIYKNTTDSYAYNNAYIDFLIENIEQGHYDPELLTDSEREQISTRLGNTNDTNPS
jgi:hypothetical protein